MKNFTKLSVMLATGVICSAGLFAQTTYTDDFSVNKDYSVDLSGTIWTGLKTEVGLVDDPAITTAALDVLNTIDNADALTFTTDSSNWSTENDNGILLYRELGAAGVDFDCKVQIVGGDFLSFDMPAVNYLSVGILARRSDTLSFVAVQAFDRPGWGAVYGLRDIPMTPQENWVWGLNAGVPVLQGVDDPDADTLKIAAYPWQRLEKKGDVFTSYASTNGTDWIKILSVTRPDMQSTKLQVGLYNATYTTAPGMVVFDDFSLTDGTPGGSGIKQYSNNDNLNVFYAAGSKSIIVSNDAQSLVSVKVISIDGRVVNTVNSIGNKIQIPVSNKGIYIVVSETQDGQVYSNKTVVY
jgi:hypothetical protein